MLFLKLDSEDAINDIKNFFAVVEIAFRTKNKLRNRSLLAKKLNECFDTKKFDNICKDIKEINDLYKEKIEAFRSVLLSEDTEDSLVCNICSKKCRNLKNHVYRSHNLSPEDYIRLFCLPENYCLYSKEFLKNSAALRENLNKCKGVKNGKI